MDRPAMIVWPAPVVAPAVQRADTLVYDGVGPEAP